MELADTVRSVLEGDTDAFREIVEALEPRLRSYCGSRLPRAEVDDVLQDVFLKAFKSLKGYDPSFPFSAWIFTIARTTIATRKLAFWREREKRERAGRETADLAASNGGQERLEEEMARNLVKALKPKYRSVVELHYFGGLTVWEIAATLSLGESAVKQRLVRSRSAMLAQMERSGTEKPGGGNREI